MKQLHWTWEKAYKKWFFLRFFLLLIVLVLSIALAHITFSQQESDENLNVAPVAPLVPHVTVADPILATTTLDTSNWRLYTNGEFEFKYPQGYDVTIDKGMAARGITITAHGIASTTNSSFVINVKGYGDDVYSAINTIYNGHFPALSKVRIEDAVWIKTIFADGGFDEADYFYVSHAKLFEIGYTLGDSNTDVFESVLSTLTIK